MVSPLLALYGDGRGVEGFLRMLAHLMGFSSTLPSLSWGRDPTVNGLNVGAEEAGGGGGGGTSPVSSP